MDKEDNALHTTRVSAVKGKYRPMDEYKKESFDMFDADWANFDGKVFI